MPSEATLTARSHNAAPHPRNLVRRILLPIVALIYLFFAGPMSASAQSISIQLQGGAFKVVGWRAAAAPPASGWASIFSVYAGEGDVPSILGTYSTESDTLVFRPQFPLAPGVNWGQIGRAHV